MTPAIGLEECSQAPICLLTSHDQSKISIEIRKERGHPFKCNYCPGNSRSVFLTTDPGKVSSFQSLDYLFSLSKGPELLEI